MSNISPKRGAFSIIEVLFAVSFLIMVGMAMISLNAAALKLISSTEIKTVANGLNEESIAVVALLKKTDPNFATTIGPNNLNCTATGGCFVDCSPTKLDQVCTLTKTSSPVQLGSSRLQFVRNVVITVPTGGTKSGANQYSVTAKVSWGNGEARQSSISQYLE